VKCEKRNRKSRRRDEEESRLEREGVNGGENGWRGGAVGGWAMNRGSVWRGVICGGRGGRGGGVGYKNIGGKARTGGVR